MLKHKFMKTVLTVGALASVGALRGEAQLRTKVSSMSTNRRRFLNIVAAYGWRLYVQRSDA